MKEIIKAEELFEEVFITGEMKSIIEEQVLGTTTLEGQAVIPGQANLRIAEIVCRAKGATAEDICLVCGCYAMSCFRGVV